MTEHAVVVVGTGPTGLILAGELALARIDVAIVERRAGQDLAGSRVTAATEIEARNRAAASAASPMASSWLSV
jgi:2-polyprenyl-6-methoxyphenol hydroxylase-like FAD-dependent oxidoreductase